MHCVPVDSSLYLSFTWHVPLLKNSTENVSIFSFVKIREIDKRRGDLQTYKYPLHTERDFVARGMDQKSGHHQCTGQMISNGRESFVLVFVLQTHVSTSKK